MSTKRLILCAVCCLLCSSAEAALNANTVWEIRTTGAQANGGGFRWLSLVSATYKWTASGSGTNEYYCQAAAGGNPSLTEAKCATTDGTFNLDTNGTLGSLNAGEWDWGDNDTLGYSTVYVRLDDGADPDTKATGFVQIGNGGGYDYSQQVAAQLTLTDGYFTSGTTFKSDTGGFTALMVGNILYISSGTHFTAGWYEIATYVSTNEVTLDRASASEDTSAHKDANFKVGGAWLLGGALDDEFTEGKVAGNRIYLAAGTYNLGEAVSQAADGTASLPISWEGYNAVRKDAPVGTNRPLISVAANQLYLNGDYSSLYHLRFTGTVTNLLYLNTGSVLYNCRVENTSGLNRIALGTNGNYMEAANCEFVSGSGTAFGGGSGGSGNRIINCYIHDSAVGITTGVGYTTITGCIIDTCSTTGISLGTTDNHTIVGNTIYNCGTGISGTTSQENVVINNIITGCTTGASLGSLYGLSFWDYNCWNNTTDVSNVIKGPHDVTGDPLLTDPAGGDFTLSAGSPAFNTGLKPSTDIGLP